jgi:hypothetical protein
MTEGGSGVSEAHAGDWIFRALLVAFAVVAAVARPSAAWWVLPLTVICLAMNLAWPRRTTNTFLGSLVLVLAVVLLGSELSGS